MKKITLTALCLATLGYLYSCNKKDNATPTYSSMDEVFARLSVKPKILTVDAATGGSFYGNSGTRYIFAANSFQTATGAPVTGQVQIAVSEFLKEGDMLFSGMLPISNGEPLISGGEIDVKATQNGQSVFLKPGYTFSANLPTSGPAPTGMLLFMGQPGSDPTRNKVNWTLANRDSISEVRKIKMSPNRQSMVLLVDSLGIISDSFKMCNADQFIKEPNYQTFTVGIRASGIALPFSKAVHCYALFDTYKGVCPLYNYSNGQFSEVRVPDIPVHFVAFTLINGKFYGGTTVATPTNGGKYTVTLFEVEAETFKKQLNDL